MRELSECRAEVFRRSEVRIKENKRRRKRVILACIPVVLCFCVIGMPWLLGKSYRESGKDIGRYDSTVDPVAVEVAGVGYRETLTNVHDVMHITELLTHYTKSFTASVTPENAPESTPDDLKYGSVSSYSITLITVDGHRTEYQLTGNTLTSPGGQKFILSQDAVASIKRLISVN